MRKKHSKRRSPKKSDYLGVENLVENLGQLRIKHKNEKGRKRRHSKTDKMDILLELDKRGLLKNVAQETVFNCKIQNFLHVIRKKTSQKISYH